MKIVIFGTNDTAALASFYFEKDTPHEVVGFTVDEKYISNNNFEGKPVVPFETIEKIFDKSFKMFLPIYNNQLRMDKARQAEQKGYELTSYISSKASVWSPIGKNCFIMEDNTIQPFVEIGNNVIMWSGNHIGHHSKIKNNVFISSHVVICGHCVVNDYCWLGANSSVRDHVELAEGTLLGMGCVVTKDTIADTKYIGIPAAPMR